MIYKNYLTIVLAIAIVFSCSTKQKTITKVEENNTAPASAEEVVVGENPLLVESTLPYGAPDFTKIKTAHFRPALMRAMEDQTQKVQIIANVRSMPTFENTILALEQSGKLLDRVANVFYALTGAHTNDDLKAIQKEMAPLFSQHTDAIYLNPGLFQKIEFLYNQRKELDLDEESERLLEDYYEDFIIAGAKLSNEDKARLKEINAREASLQTQFNQNLQAGSNAACVHFDSKHMLSGVDAKALDGMKSDKGGYDVDLINTTQQPILTSLTDRAARKTIFDASVHRTDHGDFDTSPEVLELAKLRAEKGALLGFNNYAEWKLQNTMVKTPEKIVEFFEGITPAAKDKAMKEASEIKSLMEENGVTHELEAWDWNHYAEKLRKAKYDLDEAEIKPYFELTNVLENGVFYATEKLYGITAKKRTDIPTYQEDVIVYELFEEDGTPLGLFYGDYFARPSKRGGAWMSNFVTQSHMYEKKPVIYNVMNISKPADGDPALLTYDEVTTMFHEFGHALHGFFADQYYPSLSGTSVARDFVEFPSQFMEYWALYPSVLDNYAYHYKSKKKMPQDLVNKIKKAATFNQGYSLAELLGAANLDIQWHTIPADKEIESVESFEKEALKAVGLDLRQIPPRYRSTYFNHIFGGGYSAGYYSYQWTEMLAHDANRWFEEHGGLTRENGQRYRDMVISRGNTLDYAEMYKAFAGRDPQIEPMLVARGLK